MLKRNVGEYPARFAGVGKRAHKNDHPARINTQAIAPSRWNRVSYSIAKYAFYPDGIWVITGWVPSNQSLEMTREEGIKRVSHDPSHVVILGAGASIASCIHNPEPNGLRLPAMDNFIEVVGLSDIIEATNVDTDIRNFELVYSELHRLNPNSSEIRELEERVATYFQSLTLPPTPTIYDYLVLSLRTKDLIATFNWDPFLYQAWCRNQHVGWPPRISFLHGSVSIGFSTQDEKTGPAGWYSKATGSQFVPSRLLYPVTQKDYNSDGFIRREWERLERCLRESRRITIFGYGAPDTDVEAVELMSHAWGDPAQRNIEQVEIIDVQPQDVVRERWNKFIHSHHYDYCTNYFQSVLAHFPRRTGERFMHQFLPTTPGEAFQEPNTVPPDFETLEQLWEWYEPLIEAEKAQGK